MPGATGWLQRHWAARSAATAWLLPLAAAYGLVVRLRQALYRRGIFRIERLPVPVVVVGNLVAGGAGKTPTVLALVDLLERHGYAPGIVSRGYGGSATAPLGVEPDTSPHVCGDEPLLLRRRSGVPVFVGRDRVGAARALLRAHPSIDILVSDDGRQHLRLGRDAEVLVFDERGAGNGWLLPAGPLREPMPTALPTTAVVLYNAAAPSTSLPGWLASRRLGRIAALEAWWDGTKATTTTLDDLRGRPLVAAAGIARPDRFFAMLRAAGLDPVELPLPDHDALRALPWPADAPDVVVTEKDAVKLSPGRTGTTRVWVAALDFALPPPFEAEVLRRLERRSAPAQSASHGNTPA